MAQAITPKNRKVLVTEAPSPTGYTYKRYHKVIFAGIEVAGFGDDYGLATLETALVEADRVIDKTGLLL